MITPKSGAAASSASHGQAEARSSSLARRFSFGASPCSLTAAAFWVTRKRMVLTAMRMQFIGHRQRIAR